MRLCRCVVLTRLVSYVIYMYLGVVYVCYMYNIIIYLNSTITNNYVKKSLGTSLTSYKTKFLFCKSNWDLLELPCQLLCFQLRALPLMPTGILMTRSPGSHTWFNSWVNRHALILHLCTNLTVIHTSEWYGEDMCCGGHANNYIKI